jgi:hypothetical protein
MVLNNCNKFSSAALLFAFPEQRGAVHTLLEKERQLLQLNVVADAPSSSKRRRQSVSEIKPVKDFIDRGYSTTYSPEANDPCDMELDFTPLTHSEEPVWARISVAEHEHLVREISRLTGFNLLPRYCSDLFFNLTSFSS